MRYFDRDFLKTVNGIGVTLVSAGRAEIDTTWRGAIDSPDFSRLYYVVRGDAFVRYPSGVLTLSQGAWYLLPAGVSFEYGCPSRMDHIFFHLKLCSANGVDLLAACGEPMRIASSPDTLPPDSVGDSLIDGLRLRQKLLSVILSALAERGITLSRTGFSPAVEEAMRYINENLSISLTVCEIAEHAFVSKSTLAKHFRAELGCSVGEYISDAVLSEARRQILGGKSSIRDIADSLGFSDQFYFSKKFKEKYGVPPRKYRNVPFI